MVDPVRSEATQLPKGKTCADCTCSIRCARLFGAVRLQTHCMHNPHLFQEKRLMGKANAGHATIAPVADETVACDFPTKIEEINVAIDCLVMAGTHEYRQRLGDNIKAMLSRLPNSSHADEPRSGIKVAWGSTDNRGERR